MKNLNVTYEDKDFMKLKKEKDKTELSWESFFLKLIERGFRKWN